MLDSEELYKYFKWSYEYDLETKDTGSMAPSVSFLQGCTPLRSWKLYVVIFLPVLLMPLLFIQDDEVVLTKGKLLPSKKFPCAYVIIMMALYWMVEALPLAVTAILPIIWFPLLGINSTAAVSLNYMKETNMMFLGGIMIALAVEQSHLHKRVALKIMCAIGGSPVRLMFGIMLTTMVLSMWMSNTATTAMMVPIVLAVLEALYSDDDESSLSSSRSCELTTTTNSQCTSVSVESIDTENHGDDSVQISDRTVSDAAKYRLTVEKMYLFAIAYSSNIGGTGVVTGTGPNLFVFELMQNQNVGQHGKYTDLTFASWMLFAIPSMLLNVVIAWGYLTMVFLGLPDWIAFWRKKPATNFGENERNHSRVKKMLQQKYEDLGMITFHELAVSVIFFICVMLWVFRDPKFVTGWSEFLPSVKIGDSTAAMIAVLLMFTIPKSLSCFWGGPTDTLLDWKYVQDHLPWGVLLLLGGGFALSEASDISGLSKWIGGQLAILGKCDPPVILILVMLVTAFITEVASNTATANILIPILLTLSKNLNLHPLYLTLPAAITCSYAFMLPVATPPNAIVFGASRGRMKISDMIRTGVFLNFSCVTILFLVNITLGNFMFNYSNYVYVNSTGIDVQTY